MFEAWQQTLIRPSPGDGESEFCQTLAPVTDPHILGCLEAFDWGGVSNVPWWKKAIGSLLGKQASVLGPGSFNCVFK